MPQHILESASTYFDRMFRESTAQEFFVKSGNLEDWQLIHTILDPFETDKPVSITPIQILRLIVLSERYRLASVKNYCERLLGTGQQVRVIA